MREALRRLAALGLVSFMPNRGVRVRTISRDELREAFLVRAELESLATEIAAPKFTDAELDELDAAEQPFARRRRRCARRPREGDDRWRLTHDWVRANHGFHDVIYRVAESPLIERLAKSARRTFSGHAVWAPGGSETDALYERNDYEHARSCGARGRQPARARGRSRASTCCTRSSCSRTFWSSSETASGIYAWNAASRSASTPSSRRAAAVRRPNGFSRTRPFSYRQVPATCAVDQERGHRVRGLDVEDAGR